MTTDELKTAKFATEFPKSQSKVEALIVGEHLRGATQTSVPQSWLDLHEITKLMESGFMISRGWDVAYERGWIIKW